MQTPPGAKCRTAVTQNAVCALGSWKTSDARTMDDRFAASATLCRVGGGGSGAQARPLSAPGAPHGPLIPIINGASQVGLLGSRLAASAGSSSCSRRRSWSHGRPRRASDTVAASPAASALAFATAASSLDHVSSAVASSEAAAASAALRRRALASLASASLRAAFEDRKRARGVTCLPAT